MTRINLREGQRYEYREKVWEIAERLLDGNFLVKDLSFGDKKTVSRSDIVEGLFQGVLRFEIYGKNTRASENGRLTTSFRFGDFSEVQAIKKQQALEKYFIIEPLLSLKQRTKRDIKKRINEIYNYEGKLHDGETEFKLYKNRERKGKAKVKLSVATIYRWIYEFEEAGRDIRSLIPAFHNCGAPGKSRTNRQVDSVMADVLVEKYLTQQRIKPASVHIEVKSRIDKENATLVRNGRDPLPVPCYNTIRNKIASLDVYMVTKFRYGKKKADEIFKDVYCGKEPKASRPLEYVHIDHTPIDLFLVDEEDRLPIGRPSLTLAIDEATRVILGFYVGFDEPSYRTVSECLYHSIIPKTYLKEIYPELDGELPGWGLPECIVIDNGMEFKSRSLIDSCEQLGIHPLWARPGVPQDKRVVERFFRTLNEMLLHELPGTSFSNIFDRGDYDPKKNAVISIQAFEEILHVFLIKLMTIPRMHLDGLSPLQAWNLGVEEFPPALPHRNEELIPLLAAVEYRQIRRTGIQFYEMFYNSRDLVGLKSQLDDPEEKVKIKYNPNDLSFLWVWNPAIKDYVKVFNNNQEYSKGLSLWKHKKVLAYTREKMEETGYNAFIEAKKIIEKIVDLEWYKTKRTKTRRILARFKGIEGTIYDIIRGNDTGEYFGELKEEVVQGSPTGGSIGTIKITGFSAEPPRPKSKSKKGSSKINGGRKNSSKKKNSELSIVANQEFDTSPNTEGWE